MIVCQDHGRSLPRGELTQGTHERVPLIDLRERVISGPPRNGELGQQGLSSTPFAEQIHRRAVQVALRVDHLPDLAPSFEHPNEGFLGQLVCLLPAARRQTQRGKQATMVITVEVVEMQRGRLGGRFLAAGSHDRLRSGRHRGINPRAILRVYALGRNLS